MVEGNHAEPSASAVSASSRPVHRLHRINLCCAKSVESMVGEVAHSLRGLGFEVDVSCGAQARASLLGRLPGSERPTIHVVCVQGALGDRVLKPLRQALAGHDRPNHHLFAAVLDLAMPLAMVGRIRRFAEALEHPAAARTLRDALGERRQWRELFAGRDLGEVPTRDYRPLQVVDRWRAMAGDTTGRPQARRAKRTITASKRALKIGGTHKYRATTASHPVVAIEPPPRTGRSRRSGSRRAGDASGRVAIGRIGVAQPRSRSASGGLVVPRPRLDSGPESAAERTLPDRAGAAEDATFDESSPTQVYSRAEDATLDGDPLASEVGEALVVDDDTLAEAARVADAAAEVQPARSASPEVAPPAATSRGPDPGDSLRLPRLIVDGGRPAALADRDAHDGDLLDAAFSESTGGAAEPATNEAVAPVEASEAAATALDVRGSHPRLAYAGTLPSEAFPLQKERSRRVWPWLAAAALAVAALALAVARDDTGARAERAAAVASDVASAARRDADAKTPTLAAAERAPDDAAPIPDREAERAPRVTADAPAPQPEPVDAAPIQPEAVEPAGDEPDAVEPEPVEPEPVAAAVAAPGSDEAILHDAAAQHRIGATQALYVSRKRSSATSWSQAVDRCHAFDVDGVRGWRLPFRRELKRVHAVLRLSPGVYWSRSVVEEDRDMAWALDTRSGGLVEYMKGELGGEVVCVRARAGG